MKKVAKIAGFGLVLWLVPFLSGFPFVDAQGNFVIDEIFFKSIMIVVSALTGVFLFVKYFKNIKSNYVNEAITVGLVWLVINWGLDLVMVASGFFPMSVAKYFTDIGLRYLSIPIYSIGMGIVLSKKK